MYACRVLAVDAAGFGDLSLKIPALVLQNLIRS